MPRSFVLVLALLFLGLAAYAAVRRQAALTGGAVVVALGLAVVWAGDQFGFLNV